MPIRPASIEDIDTIHSLAHRIWPIVYDGMISHEQIHYMLGLMYSHEALRDQMDNGVTFLLVITDNAPVGFASFSPVADGVYKLHKLYVLPECHGKGFGKKLLGEVKNRVMRNHGKLLELQVNMKNKARGFYESQGFRVREEISLDIGNGFRMDDYVMERALCSTTQLNPESRSFIHFTPFHINLSLVVLLNNSFYE